MKLPLISSKMVLRDKKVFLRVDWNVPLTNFGAEEDSLKLRRSIETVKMLAERGAVVLVATHLGRPRGRQMASSTQGLVKRVAKDGLKVEFLGDRLDTAKGLKEAQMKVASASAGTIFLLENVRFYSGEEKNDRLLSKAFASLADAFVNDAFASCHRAHASVVGVASLLPSVAGPTLAEEVRALERLLVKPKHPFVACIGGAKISSKVEVVKALLKVADKLLIGGAMANAFFAASGREIGASYVEREGIAIAKKLLKNSKIVLPHDAIVAKRLASGALAHRAFIDEVKKSETIGDIGPETIRLWSTILKRAKMIVWNGPMGVTTIPAFSHGSLMLARTIATRSKGAAYGVAGGGDTLPVALASGMSEWFDHLSTGGGAMLEFIAKQGKLPGLLALLRKK